MMVTVIMVMAHNVMWVAWLIQTRPPKFITFLVLSSLIVLTTAGLMEVFDFPPIWGVLDAHAMWHITTIPVPCLWWAFVLHPYYGALWEQQGEQCRKDD